MKKRMKWGLSIIAIVIALNISSFLYYRLTDGFTVSNITSNFSYNPKWDTRPLTGDEHTQINQILSQPYSYLGKGCQSYVFQSEDGLYVLKFFKYQRYRTKPWIEVFSFIPAVEKKIEDKLEHKRKKLERFFASWRIAFDELQVETGLLFVHLNKTDSLKKTVLFKDKLGLEHNLNLDEYEFLIQKKARMLTDVLNELVAKKDFDQAKALLTALLNQMLSEFKRGLVDNDTALIQNTGVLDGHPIHIDVGQFVKDDEFKNPEKYKQYLFNKTFLFRAWLKDLDPHLANTFDQDLEVIIGPEMHSMIPHFETLDN